MIAIYNGLKYKYLSSRRIKEIVTRCAMKTDNTFCEDGDIFYKEVEEEELSDIYITDFMVRYDIGYSRTPEWWKVTYNDLYENAIKIRFVEGILPNWDIEEKNVCTTLVPFQNIRETKIMYTYRKKDGKDVDNIVVEEKAELAIFIKNMSEMSESVL